MRLTTLVQSTNLDVIRRQARFNVQRLPLHALPGHAHRKEPTRP